MVQGRFAGHCRVLLGSGLQGIAGSFCRAGYCRVVSRVLQGIAGYCRVLQGRFAGCCRVLQGSGLQGVAGYCRVVLQGIAGSARGRCRMLQGVRRGPGERVGRGVLESNTGHALDRLRPEGARSFCRVSQGIAGSFAGSFAGYCRVLQGRFAGSFCRVLQGRLHGIAGYCRVVLQGVAGYCRGLVFRVLQGSAGLFCRVLQGIAGSARSLCTPPLQGIAGCAARSRGEGRERGYYKASRGNSLNHLRPKGLVGLGNRGSDLDLNC